MQAAHNGIVFAFQLDGQGGVEVLETVPDKLADNFWLHLQSDHPECAPTLRRLGLSEPVIELMTVPETRPRVVMADEGAVVVLRGVNIADDEEPEDLVSLRVWITEGRIITARKSFRYLMSVQDVRDSLSEGKGPRDASEVVVQLVERLAFRIGEVVEHNEEHLLGIEEAGLVQENRRDLTDIRRHAAQLRRYLAPQRDALDGLTRLRSVFDEAQVFELREQSDRTTRYVEDLDLARERAVLMQEELRNQLAEQQNQRMYVLSLVTAIFLPLSFLTGVFGMNVMGLPGVENPLGFVWVAASMFGLGFVVLMWMRSKKWL